MKLALSLLAVGAAATRTQQDEYTDWSCYGPWNYEECSMSWWQEDYCQGEDSCGWWYSVEEDDDWSDDWWVSCDEWESWEWC